MADCPRDEKAWAKVRQLNVENQNLRRRSHKTIHEQHARIRELEEQTQRSPWVYLPWKGYVS